MTGARRTSRRPGRGGIDTVVEFLGITASRMIKCLVYETEKGFVVALLRGDLDVNEVALKHALGVERLALASEEKVEPATGAPVGFVGPHHSSFRRDRASSPTSPCAAPSTPSRAPGGATGTSAGFALERDAKVSRWAAFAQARAGDPCPRCGKPLEIARGIEVGHIFKLGTKYSHDAPAASSPTRRARRRPVVMGSYGIGVGRTMAAAVEQHHDADGIVWPLALAPFEIELVSLNPRR